MILLIISLALCVASIWIAFYAHKRNVQATEKIKRVDERVERLRALFMPPTFGYCSKVDLDNCRVVVGGKWIIDGFIVEVCFKEFPYNEDDIEDRNFAIREAEELIDKLNEI